MAKKELDLFPGPVPGEEVVIMMASGINLGGTVVGVWDDAIALQDKDTNYMIVAKAGIMAVVIKAVPEEEVAKEGGQ